MQVYQKNNHQNERGGSGLK